MPPRKDTRKQLFYPYNSVCYEKCPKVNFGLAERADQQPFPAPRLTGPIVRPIRRGIGLTLIIRRDVGEVEWTFWNARRLPASVPRPHRSLAGHLVPRHLDRSRRRAPVACPHGLGAAAG